MGNLDTIITTSGSLINLTLIKTRSIANYTIPIESQKLDVCFIDGSVRHITQTFVSTTPHNIPLFHSRIVNQANLLYLDMDRFITIMISMNDPTSQTCMCGFYKYPEPSHWLHSSVRKKWMDQDWWPLCSATNNTFYPFKTVSHKDSLSSIIATSLITITYNYWTLITITYNYRTL